MSNADQVDSKIRELERSTIEAYVSIAIAIFTVVFPMNTVIKCLFLVVLCLMAIDVTLRSPWTKEWHSSAKAVAISFLVLVFAFACGWIYFQSVDMDAFTFKDSSSFTFRRKFRIARRITRARQYLIDLKIDVPPDFPPIGLETGDPRATGFATHYGHEKSYYDHIDLRPGMLDDDQQITQAFLTYAISRLIYKPLPPPKISDNMTLDEWKASLDTPERIEAGFKSTASLTIIDYLNHSFWNKGFETNQTPVCPDEGYMLAPVYFWRIRGRYGQEFADKLAAYTLRAVIDQPSTPGQRFKEYLYQRIATADSVVDNENSRLSGVTAILQECGWLKK